MAACCILFIIKYRFGDLVDVIDNILRSSDHCAATVVIHTFLSRGYVYLSAVGNRAGECANVLLITHL